jgi:hypothetical protein
LAERNHSIPLSLPGIRVGDLYRNRAVGFALHWYGIPLAALFGLLGALFYVRSPEVLRPIFDDSYISLTFARNLAEHAKLSFDGETWTTGATSPLHVSILAFFLKLGMNPFFTSIAVGVAGHVALAVGVYMLAWAMFRSRLAAVLASLLIAFTSLAALDAGNGLETSLFMALVAWTMASYLLSKSTKARAITGVLVALAVLTRPEGAVLLPALVLYRWFERPEGESLKDYLKDVILISAPGVLALGSNVIFSLLVSGTFGGTGSAKLEFFRENEQSLKDKVAVAFDQIGLFLGPILPLLVLSLFSGRRREIVLFGLFWLPVLAAYVYFFPGGFSHYFYRYQHPVLPLLAALAGGGGAVIIMEAMRRDILVKAAAVAGIVVISLSMYHQYVRWQEVYRQAATETYRDLEAMARELNSLIAPHEVLATHDIGAVGYFAEYQVLDLVGLVNEDVLEYHESRTVHRYLDLVRPEWLLVFPDWDYFFLWLDTRNRPDLYEEVKVYPGDWVRQAPYILYRVHYP